MPSHAAPAHADLQQAAEWYACLRDGKASLREREAWQTWLAAAEAHAMAWQYVQDISNAFEPARSLPNPRETARHLNAASDRIRSRRRALAGLGLFAGGGLAAALGWHQAWLPAEVMALGADHRTATGEQRQLTLADGTQLWLNTASAVDIRFDVHERRIVVLSGEIFVATARDARPLRVQTPQGEMRALGTRFNVHLQRSATRLAVYAGAVEIRLAATGRTLVVPAGRQTSFTPEDAEPLQTAGLDGEAWTQGTLVAENLPLGQMVEQLRRHRRGHLAVADAVAGLIVYGNFPLHDTDTALHMLASALPVRIAQPLPWWTSIEAR